MRERKRETETERDRERERQRVRVKGRERDTLKGEERKKMYLFDKSTKESFFNWIKKTQIISKI